MTSDYYSILKDFFEEVKAGTVLSRDVGLCTNFAFFFASKCFFYSYHEVEDAEEIFKRMLCNFPKYTGDPTYPLVPLDEYETHLREGFDFYDPATSYGAIRLEFVEWALEEIAQNRVSYMKS